jgi:hypothetical protein
MFDFIALLKFFLVKTGIFIRVFKSGKNFVEIDRILSRSLQKTLESIWQQCFKYNFVAYIGLYSVKGQREQRQ